jgi:hypothetical protein
MPTVHVEKLHPHSAGMANADDKKRLMATEEIKLLSFLNSYDDRAC